MRYFAYGKTDSTTGSAGRVLQRPAAAFAERVEETGSRFIAQHGIPKLRHDFFEAAAELQRGDHRVKRVAVARIDDGLENLQSLVFELGEGRCRPHSNQAVRIAHRFEQDRDRARMRNLIERGDRAQTHEPGIVAN